MKPKQIIIHIQTDDCRTADVLRELANMIENDGIESVENYETAYGCVQLLEEL